MVPASLNNAGAASPVVLLVEDEVVVRALMAEYLRAAGWTVVEAANGDEAWSFLQAGGGAHLLFSDVKMPGSIDGLTLGRLVRAAYPAIKIVMTSGDLGPRRSSEFDGFVQKPYSFAAAAALAEKLLGLPEAGA